MSRIIGEREYSVEVEAMCGMVEVQAWKPTDPVSQ